MGHLLLKVWRVRGDNVADWAKVSLRAFILHKLCGKCWDTKYISKFIPEILNWFIWIDVESPSVVEQRLQYWATLILMDINVDLNISDCMMLVGEAR